MCRLYKTQCIEEGKTKQEKYLQKNIQHREYIGFHKTKKDQCMMLWVLQTFKREGITQSGEKKRHK